MEKSSILGIDIAKDTFDVALIIEQKYVCGKFANNEPGFIALAAWLKKKDCVELHACMESTGPYGLSLANFLFESGFKVSVVNPARIKGFAQSQLLRTKTDKTDAKLIASFCQALNPPAYEPTPKIYRELQEWMQRSEVLTSMKQQEKNRLKVASSALIPLISDNINQLEVQLKKVETIIKELIKNDSTLKKNSDFLKSIPGVSSKTIGNILGYISHMKFENAKKLSAYFGLNPKHKLSGSSIRGSSHISKTGNVRLRKSLYMPALVAMRHNPIISTFCTRLVSKGKPKKLVIIAAMRKLLEIIYGVLKNQQSFNPHYRGAKIALSA